METTPTVNDELLTLLANALKDVFQIDNLDPSNPPDHITQHVTNIHAWMTQYAPEYLQ
jgi:LmbE family N-acetylglucosaminyl deacetylase